LTITEVSVENKKDNDTKSSSPKPHATRFSFYDAEGISYQILKEEGDKEGEKNKNPRRFNFYNTAEIFRSLHEMERQRSHKESTNQRLVTTPRFRNNSQKDAHVHTQQTITPEDVVMQSRMDAEGGFESREVERQDRQECMAKYASKMVESKSETFTLSCESPETKWTPILETLFNAEKLNMKRSQSDDFRDLSPVGPEEEWFDAEEWTPCRSEPDDYGTSALQDPPAQDPSSLDTTRNVKQFFNTILDRARFVERKNINHEIELDALNRAMEDLQQPSLSFETLSTVQSQHVRIDEKVKSKGWFISSHWWMTCWMQKKKECSYAQDPMPEAPLTPTDAPMAPDSLGTAPIDEVYEYPYDESNVASLSSIEDGTEELLAVDTEENEIFEDEDGFDPNNHLLEESNEKNALGPLSRGNCSDVVLEASEPPPLPPSPPVKSPSPFSLASIYETLSSAVREAKSFMSSMMSPKVLACSLVLESSLELLEYSSQQSRHMTVCPLTAKKLQATAMFLQTTVFLFQATAFVLQATAIFLQAWARKLQARG
jgi:hypothetical protein